MELMLITAMPTGSVADPMYVTSTFLPSGRSRVCSGVGPGHPRSAFKTTLALVRVVGSLSTNAYVCMSTKLRSEGLVSSRCVFPFISDVKPTSATMKHDKMDKVIRFLRFIGMTPCSSVEVGKVLASLRMMALIYTCSTRPYHAKCRKDGGRTPKAACREVLLCTNRLETEAQS